jgi:hypothetical protein
MRLSFAWLNPDIDLMESFPALHPVISSTLEYVSSQALWADLLPQKNWKALAINLSAAQCIPFMGALIFCWWRMWHLAARLQVGAHQNRGACLPHYWGEGSRARGISVGPGSIV